MKETKKVAKKNPVKIKVKKDKNANKEMTVKCNVTKVTKIVMVTRNKFRLGDYSWRDLVWAFSLGIIVGVIIVKV